MKNSVVSRLFAPTLLLLGSVLFGPGCMQDSAVNPQGFVPSGNVVQSTNGPIRILGKSDGGDHILGKGKGGLPDSVFVKMKLIKAKKGGEIAVGNKRYGKSKIKFRKHDLPKDMEIYFEWAPGATFEGMLNNVLFGPHGTVFNQPVRIELSYRGADLNGVDETSLKLYYFHEKIGLWEEIGGKVDVKKKLIKARLKHFSRYALAWSR